MSLFLDNYRQARPEDKRTDAEIVLDLGGRWPDVLEKYPDFKAEFDRAKAPPSVPPDDADAMHARSLAQFPVSAGDYAKNAVGSGVRSFFGGLADIPEVVSVLGAELDRKFGGVVGSAVVPDLSRKLLLDPAATTLHATGEALAPEQDSRLEDSFWATKVPGGVGSALSFAATGGVGKALSAGARVGATGLKLWVAENAAIAAAGAASSANQAYKEALAKGADHDSASMAGLLNLPIGVTEVVPLSRMLKRLDGISGGTFSKFLWNSTKETFEEAAQEAVQTVGSNFVAQKWYDKDRTLLQDLEQNAEVGGVTGFIFSAFTQAVGLAIGARHGTHVPPVGPRQGPLERPTETISGAPASDIPTPPVTGPTPPTAAVPPTIAPAGTVASPVEPVIAAGMESLTGAQDPATTLALKTWAEAEADGTMGVMMKAQRDALFAQSAELASAYSIVLAEAEKTKGERAGTEQAPPAPTPPVPAPAPAPPPLEPVTKEDLVVIARSVLERGEALPNPTPAQQATTTTLRAILSNPAGIHYESLAGQLDLRIDDNASLVPSRFAADVSGSNRGRHDTGERLVRGSTAVTPTAPALQPEPAPPAGGGEVGSDTGGTRVQRAPPGPAPTAWEIRNRLLRRSVTPLNPSLPSPTGPTGQTGPIGQGESATLPVVSPPVAPAAPVAPTPLERIAKVVGGVKARVRVKVDEALVKRRAISVTDASKEIDEQNPQATDLRGLTPEQIGPAVISAAAVDLRPIDPLTGKRLRKPVKGPALDDQGKPREGEVKKKRLPTTQTLRRTFFLDTVTGVVFGVGTYANQESSKGGTYVPYVGRAPGYKTGMPLWTFLMGGNTGAGGKKQVPGGRYKALHTYLMGQAIDAKTEDHVVLFANVAEYEARYLAQSIMMVEALGKYAATIGATRGVVQGKQQTGSPMIEATSSGVETDAEELHTSDGVDEDPDAPEPDAKPGIDPDELAAEEAEEKEAQAFKINDAAAIYLSVKGVTGTSQGHLIAAIGDSRRATRASIKMLAVIGKAWKGQEGKGDRRDAMGKLLDWIYAAKYIAQQTPGNLEEKQNTFAKTLEAAFAGEVNANAGSSGTQAGTEAAAEPTGPSPAGQDQAASVGTGGGAGAAGADVATVGAGGQGTASSVAGKADSVKRADEKPASHVVITHGERRHTAPADLAGEVGAAYQATLFSMGSQGVDVTVIEQGVTGVTEEISGVYGQQAGKPLVIVHVNDMGNPSMGSFHVLVAEVAHHVFAELPASDQTRLQNAVRTVTDAFLGITGDNLSVSEGIPLEQQDAVMQEERLVDATARALTGEGFNPAEAQGIAQALWRAIKDLFLRIGQVMHSAWMGAGSREQGAELGARMAQAYFENRVKSWLARDAITLSFTDFMGGPGTRTMPGLARRATWFTPAHGEGIAWRWNPDTFEFDVAEASMDSAAAVKANFELPSIRYHRNSKAKTSPDLGPEVRIPDFAVANEMQAFLEAQFANYTAQGLNVVTPMNVVPAPQALGSPLTPPAGHVLFTHGATHPALTLDTIVNGQLVPGTFLPWVLPAGTHSPAAVKAAMVTEMAARPLANPNVRMATLNEATKVEVANKAIVQINTLRSDWQQRNVDARFAVSDDPKSTQTEFNKQVSRTLNLIGNYTDAEFLFSEMKDNVTGWVRMLRDGLREGFYEGRDAGRQIGVMEQVIKQIEGKMDGKVGRQYLDALNKLANGFQTPAERTKFVLMMQKVAALPVWLGQSTPQEVRDIISASTDPALASLTHDTPDSRALLAIAGAFAKENALMMHALALRAAAGDASLAKERADLNAYLKLATSDNAAVVANVRRDVNKLTKLKVRANALLDAVEASKKQQEVLLDELARATRWIDFYAEADPLLERQAAGLEAIMGAARADFEGAEGDTFRAPAFITQAPKDWPTIIFAHTRDGHIPLEVLAGQRRLDEYWKAQEGTPLQDSADAAYAQRTSNKLAEAAIQGKAHQHVRRVIQVLFGAMTTKLEQTGVPAFKNVARRLRDYQAHHDAYQRPSDVKAVTYSNAENKARKVMGYRRRQLRNFRKKVMNPAWFYFNERKDLLYGAATNEEGKRLRLEATLDFMGLTPRQRPVMENLLRVWADTSAWHVENLAKMGGKVDDDASGMTRGARGAWGEVMRRMSGDLDLVYDQMHGSAGQAGPWANDPLGPTLDHNDQPVKRDLAREYEDDPAKLRKALAPLFSPPMIWDLFVRPIANRSGAAMINGPKDSAGINSLVRVADARAAFAATAEGDIVGFAEKLFDIANVPTAKRSEFVAQTIGLFHSVFQQVHAQHQEASAASKNSMENITSLLMNARRGENWPAEFLDYRPFDLQHSRSLVNHMAMNVAFGRGMAGINGDFAAGQSQLSVRSKLLETITDEAQEENPTATPKQVTKILEGKAKDHGFKLAELQLANHSLVMAQAEQRRLQTFVASQGGVAQEFRAWSELMSTAVAAVVQGVSTHLLDTISLFKPIQLHGMSTPALFHTGRNIRGYFQSRAGSLMELFGRTMVDEAGHMQRAFDLGVQDTNAQHTLMERLVAVRMNASVPEGASTREWLGSIFAVAGRGTRELISTGIPTRAKNSIYPKIKPAGAFTSGTQHMLLGATKAAWETFADLTNRAVQWAQAGPGRMAQLQSVGFEFTAAHAAELGYANKLFGLLQDKAAYENMLVILGEYGLSLHGLARDFIERRAAAAPGAPVSVLSDRAFERLLPFAPAEILQESSLLTRPSALIANPVIRANLPLIGWAWAQTGSVIGSFYPRLGHAQLQDVTRGLWSFAAMMGVGLGYALMRDLYDEELLGKKSNRLTVGRDDTFHALVDRMDQVGAVGFLGSVANSFINGQTTARDFSIDSRVFQVSAFMNLHRALSDWVHQGTATYATVGRPIAQSLGLSGYLQYAQILNTLTGGIFEGEARTTARINAGNWLMVAGRELKLDVRTGHGSGSQPNSTTPYVREMAMAAYGNDPVEFAEAYRNAVLAARDEKKPDPQDFVKRSYEAQHPLRSRFKTQLSDLDVRRIMARLPEGGRQDVMEAVRLFNRFGSRLDIDPYWGKAAREGSVLGRSVADVLKSQARMPALGGPGGY